jgi:hypothetical protein
MNGDVAKVLSIFSTILVLGLILKDSSQFDTVVKAAASGTNTILTTLEAAG